MAGHPRWVPLLRELVNKSMKEDKDRISYAIATIDSSKSPPAPRVRYVVHRGFVNERRASEDRSWSNNDAEDSNGDEIISISMMVTSDVRAPKSHQIESCETVEFAWWLAPTQHQFRVRSHAYMFAQPGHPINDHFPGSRLAPNEGSKPFDWESERKRIYRKMSPELRASFVRPVPGTPLAGTDIDPTNFPTSLPNDIDADATEEEKAQIKESLENFALVVMEPFEVDMCDLGAVPNIRTQWKSEKGKWIEFAVVP